MRKVWWIMAAGLAAGLQLAGAQGVVQFYGSDRGTKLGPNSEAAAAAFELEAGGMGPLSLLDFEMVTLGDFLNLSPAETGVAGLSILAAAESSGLDTGISDEPFTFLGFNTTAGGDRFLKIEEMQPGAGVEPAVGVTFRFDSPLAAFGAYITGADSDVPGSVTAIFNDGQQRVISLDGDPGGGSQFWGFTDPSLVGITSVTFLSSPEGGVNGDAFGIDDVRWVTVPEPGVAGLLLVAAALMLRRRR